MFVSKGNLILNRTFLERITWWIDKIVLRIFVKCVNKTRIKRSETIICQVADRIIAIFFIGHSIMLEFIIRYCWIKSTYVAYYISRSFHVDDTQSESQLEPARWFSNVLQCIVWKHFFLLCSQSFRRCLFVTSDAIYISFVLLIYSSSILAILSLTSCFQIFVLHSYSLFFRMTQY